MDCVFCKIAAGDLPAHTVYQSGKAIAFLDLHPHAVGHTVVVPRRHSETILDLPDADVEEFFLTVKRATARLLERLQPDGFTLGINHGSVAGQAISHFHLHILPRCAGDGGGSIHTVVNRPPQESLQSIASRICI